jgi:hypothetical protein
MFLFQRPKDVTRDPAPQPPPWTGMTLQRWRDSEEHVAWAGELFRHPKFHQAIEVLWSQLPIAPLSKDTDYAAQVGRLQGYREALAVLMELPVTQETPSAEDIVVDYSGRTFDND